MLRYQLRYRLVRVIDTQQRHYFHGFTTAPSEPWLVRVTEWGAQLDVPLFHAIEAANVHHDTTLSLAGAGLRGGSVAVNASR